MFIKSLLLCFLMIALAIGVLLALVLPPWILAVVLASLIIIYGISLWCKL